MDQIELIREQVRRSLNEKLLPFLTSRTKEGGGAPNSAALSKLSSPEFRDRIEKVISTEVDAFFSSMQKEDLFASTVSMAMPSGPASKLQKALIDESTRVLLDQIREQTTSLRNRLNSLPDMMLNRRWILKTLEGVFHDVVHRTPLQIDQDNIAKILGSFTHELLDHVEISHASLGGLKRSLTEEIYAEVASYVDSGTASGKLKLPSDNGRSTAEEASRRAHLDKMLVEGLANDLAREFSAIVTNLEPELPAISRAEAALSLAAADAPRSSHAFSRRQGACHTLVIHCVDSRFQENFEDFLSLDLGYAREKRMHLAIPGGVQAMTLKRYLPKFEWAIRKWISFMDELSEFEQVICIAHEDCKWYQEARFTPVKSRLMKASEHERQFEDLHQAAALIGELIPRASVELYQMKISEVSNRVSFEGVSI